MDKASSKTKNEIFLSHSHADKELVGLINQLLENVFSKMFYVFDTSNNPLTGGSKWREEVRQHLKNSIAILVIITPQSVNRDWVFFEAGAAWHEAEDNNNNKKLIPCLYNVEKYPSPLSEFIGYNIKEETDIRRLISSLKELIDIEPPKEHIDNSIQEYLKKINDPAIEKNVNKEENLVSKTDSDALEVFISKLLILLTGYFDDSSAREFIKLLKKHNMIDKDTIENFMETEAKKRF